MSAPRKETVAAEVSTSAMLCEMYPSAVKAPQRIAWLGKGLGLGLTPP